MLDLPSHLARALLANYPEFPDSSLWIEFFVLVQVLQVLVDRPNLVPLWWARTANPGSRSSQKSVIQRPATSSAINISYILLAALW